MRIEFELTPSDAALAPLREAWQNAGARHAGRHAELADRARARHAELASLAMPGSVREPLSVIPRVADLLDSPHWDTDAAAREQFAGALAYFVDPDDLIPDGDSRYGFLDDAFVLKLALAEARHEWFAWCDYIDYVAAHPEEAGIDRATWMTRRRERLEQELRRRSDRDESWVARRRYAARPEALPRFGVR